MDIINTQHVEKILADRRRNSSSNSNNNNNSNNNSNNYDDNITESDVDAYPTSDTLIDFDYNTNIPKQQQQNRNRQPLPIHGDVVMKYNDTSITTLASKFPNVDPNLLSELQNYRGDKILKSSKSALYIAQKELLKQDWCKTEPFEQKIREDGCYSKRITNSFCYGQCNSFYIPKMVKRRRRAHTNNGGGTNKRSDHRSNKNHHSINDSFRSCAYCKPKESTFITVVLKCPNLTPNYRRKRVEIVKECRCIAQNMKNTNSN
jgi:hypothetical protein